MDSIEWVGTGGGPLILIRPRSPITGGETRRSGPPTGDLSLIWETVLKNSDYGRACNVDGYLGVLEVGPGACLALGDEPMQTTMLPTDDGGLIVPGCLPSLRRTYSARCRAVPEDLWEETPHPIDVGIGGLLILDSAYPGDGRPTACGDGANVSWLIVALPPGTYRSIPPITIRMT